jgi:hypothetical protein
MHNEILKRKKTEILIGAIKKNVFPNSKYIACMDTIRNKKKRKESFVCCTCIPFTLAAPRHNAKRKHPEDRYGIILTRKLAIAERWAYGHMPPKKKPLQRDICRLAERG